MVSTTCIALLFPSFNDMLGVIGAVKFWPLGVYFPCGDVHCTEKGPTMDTQVEPALNFELHVTF